MTDDNASIQMAEREGLKEVVLSNRKGGTFPSPTYAKWSLRGANHLFHPFRELISVLP